jgi:outer membrane protein assembly factor BamB
MLPVWFVLILGSATGFASENWPGFRGTGDGVSRATKVPVEWSPKKNLAWKVDLPGYGQSSPVVWKGRVYVTAVKGPNKDKNLVLALDGSTGKLLWEKAFDSTQPRKSTTTVSRAAPTPAVDAAGVYAFFESGDLVRLSHEGKSAWSRSLAKEYGEFKGAHGLGSSLAQNARAVFVLADHQGPAYLLAIDKKTGKNLWKADRKSRGSWTSPVVLTLGGKEQVVVSSNGSVAGYDAATGKELWAVEGVAGNTIPSATVAGSDRLLIGAGKPRGGAAEGKPVTTNCCLRLEVKDGKTTCHTVWKAPNAVAYYATPLAYKGCAYLVNSAGVVQCLDLESGKLLYSGRTSGACWASPVGVGDRVYLFGKDGVTTVLRTGPKFEELARNSLWDESKKAPAPEKNEEQGGGSSRRPGGYGPDTPTVYGTAVVDGAIYLRTGTTLFCVRAGR